MASIAAAAHESSSALADALLPASIFAPDRGGCLDDPGDELYEDGDMVNGEPKDRRIDFTSKVKLGPRWLSATASWLFVKTNE